jgi:hypothetical protein
MMADIINSKKKTNALENIPVAYVIIIIIINIIVVVVSQEYWRRG